MNQLPVFVYGTLRRGGSNSFRMSGAEFVGKGRVSGRMYRIDWRPDLIYPALVCGGHGWVKGELYMVSEECMRELDRFEGVTPSEDDEYRRVEIPVIMDDGEERCAWVWEWQAEFCGARFLEDGDWLNHEPEPS